MLTHHTIEKGEKPIFLDLNLTSQTNQPLVIFSHGFKGFKDWGPFNYVSDTFVNAGINFLKFNFSHNGISHDDFGSFNDLESFGNNNFSKELLDLKIVIDWAISTLTDQVDINSIILMGHSRGGGISIIKASEDNRIKKVISWASVCDFEHRFPKDKIDVWKKRGVAYVFNSRTNQQMPLFYQFYEDFINNKERLSIPNACKLLTIPTLIVHGKKDETVDFDDALELKNSIKNSKLVAIDQGGHVFNSSHPFDKEQLSLELKTAIDQSIIFIKQ